MHVWPKIITQFQNQCRINLQKLQLSVTHHWKPPWFWLCTGQGIIYVTNTSSSTWSAEVAIHDKLSEDNPTGFRGAVLFEMLQKNTGSVSGCILRSLKKDMKRAKKCKVDTDKILKCVKCAENCNETKTCANKSGLEAVDHMYMTQKWLFLSFSILIPTLIALVENLSPDPSSVILVWYLPDVGSQQQLEAKVTLCFNRQDFKQLLLFMTLSFSLPQAIQKTWWRISANADVYTVDPKIWGWVTRT